MEGGEKVKMFRVPDNTTCGGQERCNALGRLSLWLKLGGRSMCIPRGWGRGMMVMLAVRSTQCVGSSRLQQRDMPSSTQKVGMVGWRHVACRMGMGMGRISQESGDGGWSAERCRAFGAV